MGSLPTHTYSCNLLLILLSDNGSPLILLVVQVSLLQKVCLFLILSRKCHHLHNIHSSYIWYASNSLQLTVFQKSTSHLCTSSNLNYFHLSHHLFSGKLWSSITFPLHFLHSHLIILQLSFLKTKQDDEKFQTCTQMFTPNTL